MRLRHFLLLAFLFMALGPLLLFRAWPHSEVLQGELDEVHERHLLLARNLAAALERYHRDLVTTFDLFAASPDTWSNTPSTKRMLENLSFRHLCSVDEETGRVVDALASVAAPCPDVIPPNTLARLTSLATPGVVSFGSVVTAPDGENVIHLVVRKNDLLVIGAITTAYFRELGEAIAFGVKGHAAIVDQTGRALSHPLAGWVKERKDMSKISAVQRMLNRETGVETFYSPALKGDMIAGFAFVDPVGWGVMIPQPIAELYQRADDAQRSSLIVLIIGAASALILAYTLALRVVRPLEQVSRASSAIAKGEFTSSKPPVPSRFLPIELSELQIRFHDMVERLHKNLKTINNLAYKDPLTGLGNRTTLQKHLENAIDRGIEGTLVLIDLDGFKSVNDAFGHDAGDTVLDVVGERLHRILGVNASVAECPETYANAQTFDGASACISRMGGDEFAIWIPQLSRQETDLLSQNIVTQLSAPIFIENAPVTIGASAGTARFPADAQDRASLTKAADLALYDAKNRGKNRHSLFTPELRAASDEKQRNADDIRDGLKKGEFVPFFQPQFSLPDQKLAGIEALARWEHPKRGLLMPVDFIPTAEEIGLINDIDETIFDQSVQHLTRLADTGLTVESLAVNVSAQRLLSQDFQAMLDSLPKLAFELRFELMETMVLDKISSRLAWTLDKIRDDGHKIDLDDFGSANASILGLMNIEPAHLKIDKHLIFAIGNGTVADRLVLSIIEMAHSLQVPVIAEGAEDMRAIERLNEMRCDFVQGFSLAAPMQAAKLEDFLRDYHNSQPNVRSGSTD